MTQVHPRIDEDEKQYIIATTGRKAQTITVNLGCFITIVFSSPVI